MNFVDVMFIEIFYFGYVDFGFHVPFFFKDFYFFLIIIFQFLSIFVIPKRYIYYNYLLSSRSYYSCIFWFLKSRSLVTKSSVSFIIFSLYFLNFNSYSYMISFFSYSISSWCLVSNMYYWCHSMKLSNYSHQIDCKLYY